MGADLTVRNARLFAWSKGKDRLTRYFEGRRQYLSDEKWLILSILYSIKSRQHSLERIRNDSCRVSDAIGSTVRPWWSTLFHSMRSLIDYLPGLKVN